jgi:serine/threonine protein kinase
MIGQKIAHYKVAEKIGAGGMGEVYRARDTKLDRDVALKILPESFAVDEERQAVPQRPRAVSYYESALNQQTASEHGPDDRGELVSRI